MARRLRFDIFRKENEVGRDKDISSFSRKRLFLPPASLVSLDRTTSYGLVVARVLSETRSPVLKFDTLASLAILNSSGLFTASTIPSRHHEDLDVLSLPPDLARLGTIRLSSARRETEQYA